MKEKQFIEYLICFGLTRQEAVIYLHLLTEGKQTGYELSKQTGISRSNTYSTLASLVEKGAAYALEESAKKYIPVSLEEFCENRIRSLQEGKDWMLENMPGVHVEEEGYITIEGKTHIKDKMEHLLSQAESRVYVSCSKECLVELLPGLLKLIEDRKKVVVITDEPFALSGASVYVSEEKHFQIGIITDSRYVITGEYGDGSMNTCLYSGQKNFVSLFKNALANEIKLIQYTKERQE